MAEDNTVNRKLIVRMPEKRGHKTEVVVNGLLALEALSRRSYGAVLMDVQIPELDGRDATSQLRLRERGTTNHQIVIALTAHVTKGDHDGCIAAGMDAYLSKPIRPQELDDLLAQLIAARNKIPRSMPFPVPT